MGTIAIRNARIIDGSGSPGFPGDVLVREGRIASVGAAGAADREVDAGGMVLCPGFVDVHSHDDGAFIRYPGMQFKLAQGVTTEVSGNCGFSAAPNRPGERLPVGGGIVGSESTWEDMEGYFGACEARRPAINNAMLVGHNTVRWLAMGMERREPTAEEMATMRGLVTKAMEQGAVGFSTGLIYEPGRYSQTDEVVTLCAESGAAGGVYATHMRNEGDKLLDAVREALHIAREAKTPLHISHHKASGKRNWGRVGESFALAEGEGADVEVTWDVYPYIAGSGPMAQYFRLDAVDTVLAENTRIANCPAFREYEGRMVPEIAGAEGLSLEETVRRIITAPRGTETICIQFTMDEGDVATNLRHPRVMVGSDGIPDLNGKPHPRLYGTFPRVLGKYVREEGVLGLEEAIRRMTSLSCERFGLAGRGRV
ncbi:MAG: D-aminoacylase, partial [Dehalococcoidia bacterium]